MLTRSQDGDNIKRNPIYSAKNNTLLDLCVVIYMVYEVFTKGSCL